MLAVLRRRDFALLWLAGLVSYTGDWMLSVALPVTVYALTGSALATGGVLIANKITALVLSSIAGVFVDRWDRKRTMVVANLIRAPVVLLLLAFTSAERVWIVYLVAAVNSAVGQFFRPAENALLPRLVDEEQLVPANALNSLNDNVSRLIGPALGGLAAAWLGLRGVVAADAGSFLVAAGMIGAIATATRPERAPAMAGGVTGSRTAIWRELRDGLRLIWRHPVLRVVFAVFALASLGEGVFQTAFWIYVDEALHGGAGEAGWLMSAQAIGGLIGAVVIGTWGKTRSALSLIGWGSIGLGLVDLAVFNYPAFIPGIWLGLGLMALVGIPATAFGTGYTTAIQTEAADAYRGRVFGALGALSALFMIAGATIAGLATPRLGAVTVLTIDSLGYIAGGVLALAPLAPRSVARVKRGWPTTP